MIQISRCIQINLSGVSLIFTNNKTRVEILTHWNYYTLQFTNNLLFIHSTRCNAFSKFGLWMNKILSNFWGCFHRRKWIPAFHRKGGVFFTMQHDKSNIEYVNWPFLFWLIVLHAISTIAENIKWILALNDLYSGTLLF